jgi:hypothetical protein
MPLSEFYELMREGIDEPLDANQYIGTDEDAVFGAHDLPGGGGGGGSSFNMASITGGDLISVFAGISNLHINLMSLSNLPPGGLNSTDLLLKETAAGLRESIEVSALSLHPAATLGGSGIGNLMTINSQALDLQRQDPNTFLAGPAVGEAGPSAPDFRNIINLDLPSMFGLFSATVINDTDVLTIETVGGLKEIVTALQLKTYITGA